MKILLGTRGPLRYERVETDERWAIDQQTNIESGAIYFETFTLYEYVSPTLGENITHETYESPAWFGHRGCGNSTLAGARAHLQVLRAHYTYPHTGGFSPERLATMFTTRTKTTPTQEPQS